MGELDDFLKSFDDFNTFKPETKWDYKIGLKEVELIVPLSTDPHPFMLASFASVVFVIEKILEDKHNKNCKIIVTFVNFGNISISNEIVDNIFRTTFIYHYHRFLRNPDSATFDDSLLVPLIYMRYDEFKTTIKNIFSSIQWKSRDRRTKDIVQDIKFAKFSDYHSSNNLDPGIIEKTDESVKKKIEQLPDTTFIEPEPKFIKLRKNLLSYSEGGSFSIMTCFLNILYHTGKGSQERRRILILHNTILNMIKGIYIDIGLMANQQQYIANAIKDNVVYFNEVKVDGRFPQYYNIISRYLYKKDDKYVIDTLYFSSLLKTLKSPLFLPNDTLDYEQFYGDMIKRISDKKEQSADNDASRKVIKDTIIEIIGRHFKDYLTTIVKSTKNVENYIRMIESKYDFSDVPYEKLAGLSFYEKRKILIEQLNPNRIEKIITDTATKTGSKIIMGVVSDTIAGVNSEIAKNKIQLATKIYEKIIEELISKTAYSGLLTDYYNLESGKRDIDDIKLAIQNGFLDIQRQMIDQFKLIV